MMNASGFRHGMLNGTTLLRINTRKASCANTNNMESKP